MNTSKKGATVRPEELKLWLPVDAVIANDRPAIEWMDLRGVEFKEPFFTETLERVNDEELRRRVTTDIDTLLQFEKSCAGLSPAGFIFHGSRCGSTLVANACRGLAGSLVMSEAPPIDKIISRFFTDAEPGSTKELLYLVLLRATVSALGQRLKGEESRYFVKLACTSTLQMKRLRHIWPNIPFVFIYRDPVEVIVSNLRAIPEWMKPESNPATAAAIVGVDSDQLNSLSPEEYCARALGRFYSTASANLDARTAFVNYEQLSVEVLIEIVRFFGIEPTAAERDVIDKVSRLYSKDLTRIQKFEPDSAAKRSLASPRVWELSEKWARSEYECLNKNALAQFS
ncbi:MAG TPA: hypothetical protein VLE19_09340 [Pyrinomonadaceae bacterium]|nr:hypothetical protein [Pyrinomonadaceae bacterium]